MRSKLLFIFLFFFLFIPQKTFAATPVSFEQTEKLKPLIHWHDYSPQAFETAAKQHKPLFLLLTAPTWCYACQLYESTKSLYSPEVVKLLNEKFIPVYIDTDKRQDVTRQYLLGGWPSTIILSPKKDQLDAFLGQRSPQSLIIILAAAQQKMQNKTLTVSHGLIYKKTPAIIPTQNQLQQVIKNYSDFLIGSFDTTYGGFGITNRKYPQGLSADFALEQYDKTHDKQWLTMVQTMVWNQYTTPDEVSTNYHLFDPIDGGFHRLSSARNWTFPHFEKMLYDNARLLKAYSHLLQITPDDQLAKDSVQKTRMYIQNNWYDSQNGGFYGNTDSGNGGEYYQQQNRSKSIRVEKTKYTNWNSEAILTYLYLLKTECHAAQSQSENCRNYKQMAQQSLDFLMDELVADKGAYHYLTKDMQKFLRGNITDNAYALLAFEEGYELFQDITYLETAKRIADYSLQELYDWNTGGFFERHSPDKQLYAPGEDIILKKPFEEQGIMAYALAKLFTHTKDKKYLNAGVKTMGIKLSEANNFTSTLTVEDGNGAHFEPDLGYYYVKAAQYILQQHLLTDFTTNVQLISELERQQQQHFWLAEVLKNQPSGQFCTGPNCLLSNPSQESPTNGPFLLFMLVALIAGILSILSPCAFPILPSFLAFSLKSSKQNVVTMTVSFLLGLSFIFILLGMGATVFGGFLKSHITLFSGISGIAIMIFGIMTLLGKELPGFHLHQKNPPSYLAAFVFGSAFGISWTPCVGPILVSILVLAATSASIFAGGLLLFLYTVGLSIPLVLLAFFLKKRNENNKFWKLLRGKELRIIFGEKIFAIHTTTLFSGILFIILGYLMFSGTLYTLNQFVANNFFQQFLFSAEDKILKLL